MIVDDNDITVVTSNVSTGSTGSIESEKSDANTYTPMRTSTHPTTIQQSAFSSFSPKNASKWAYAAMTIASTEAIADLGATQIFVMDGIPVHNKQKTTCPLKVSLANGRRVTSTHMCDIIIPGLPTTLVGHIIPELSIASLFGIRVLTAAGCTVKFDNEKCVVKYNGNIILTGMKDPTTDLWTLPIVGSAGKTSQMDTQDEHDVFDILHQEFLERANAAYSNAPSSLAVPSCASTQAYGTIKVRTRSHQHQCKFVRTANPTNPPTNDLGLFTHTVRTKANSIRFAHQSMCSPTISTLLKAIRRGFLNGCPNLSAKGVTRYLNPSPATAKGHMKRPHQGIRGTTAQQQCLPPSGHQGPTIQPAPIADDKSWMEDISEASVHEGQFNHGPSVIVEDDDSSVGNIFCFAAFADKRTGVLYNDLTGSFPYMSLEGNVCYLVVYHYESNAILGLPISGFDDNTVFAAYKTQFEFLESKGYKIKLNVMDNQCTKQIKNFLTDKDCKLMLVEPHNHRVNAAERAIQTYKNHFISALATTDSEFPLQLWDRLTSQVETTLNLMRASRINPNISAYEAIWVPPCTPRMQSRHLRIPRSKRSMGKPWNRRVVPRPIARPLPMLSLFFP
jgi:hypothetical protein